MQRLFIPALLLSFVIAGAAVKLGMGGPIIYPFWAAAAWLALFVVAVIAFRRRSLWFLIGAPFALGPALLIYWYVATCVPTKSCL